MASEVAISRTFRRAVQFAPVVSYVVSDCAVSQIVVDMAGARISASNHETNIRPNTTQFALFLGGVAQRLERVFYKGRVVGSIPTVPTIFHSNHDSSVRPVR